MLVIRVNYAHTIENSDFVYEALGDGKMTRIRLAAATLLLVLLSCFALAPAINAQATSLVYGDALTGSISAQTPLGLYTFTGAADDHVTIRVIGITPELNPAISLLSPAQQQLMANDDDPFSPDGLDARITVRLPTDGIYTILVSGSGASLGEYLITLDGRSSDGVNAILPGITAVADFSASAEPQFYAIPGDPAATQMLRLAPDPLGFGFAAEVRDPAGMVIAAFTNLPSAQIALAPAAGMYEVALRPISPEITGGVQITVTGIGEPQIVPAATATLPPLPTIPPLPTLDLTPTLVPTPTICMVFSNGPVNVRFGPGINFDIIGSLLPGQPLPVFGLSPDRIWYAVNFNGVQGWVSSTVTFLNGPCANLPVLVSPPTPTPLPTTPAPTLTPTFVFSTATATTIPQPTATFVVPVPPIATITPDQTFNFGIVYNEGRTFTEFISYPGQYRDIINLSVADFGGFAALTFNLNLQCLGNGAMEQTMWGTGQPSQECGTPLSLIFTPDSNLIPITVVNQGPLAANVQYTITISPAP